MDAERHNTKLSRDFRECIESLNAHGVEFVLVGGYAVGWYGFVRATGDINFLYRQSPANVQQLCKALDAFGSPHHLIDRAFLSSPGAVTQIGNEPLRIDLLGSISGVSFDEVRAGAEEIDLDGQRLLIIGLKQLLTNKRVSGRKKDEADLRQLSKLATPGKKRR